MAKGESQNGGNKKTKHVKFTENTHFLLPDTHTYVCVSGGRKYSFFGKLGVHCFLVTSILRFALLLYYRRVCPFMHDDRKWWNIILKSCAENTERFWKYVWPVFVILHERVNTINCCHGINAGFSRSRYFFFFGQILFMSNPVSVTKLGVMVNLRDIFWTLSNI